VAGALNVAVEHIQVSLLEVRSTSDAVAVASRQLSASSGSISQGAQEQASSLEETAASLEEILPFVDLILVMTVDPGAGGQSMIPSCLAKAARLVALRKELGLGYLVSIDGGVNAESLPMIADARPDVLVMGSAFFAAEDPKAAVCAAKDAFAARGGARGASGRMADVR